MKKNVLAAGLAAVMAVASTASFAADRGNVYVAVDAGQARHHLHGQPGESVDTNDTAVSVRFGYVWHWAVDFGVEGGYVDLGKATDDYTQNNAGYDSYMSIEGSGPFAGANVKYHFADAWYVAARAGLFQSHVKIRDHDGAPDGVALHASSSTGSWYAGVGVGVDLTSALSLGLNYVNFRNKLAFVDSSTYNTGMFALSAEYRF